MLQKYPNNILKKHFVESSVLPSRFQSEAIYSIKDLWIKRKNQYEEDCLLYNDDFYRWMYMDETSVSFRCDNISLSTLGLYVINTGSNMYKISTRRGLWPQAAFWVLCLICDKQIVDIFEMYPQRAQRAGGISKDSFQSGKRL